jgi:hypothetical protein
MAAKKRKRLKNRNPFMRLLRFFAAIPLTLTLTANSVSRPVKPGQTDCSWSSRLKNNANALQ